MTPPDRPPGAPARARPPRLTRAYTLLTSPKLAIALLVGVLLCCLVGVTVYSAEEAWALIFSALWFNGLLALLAVSSALAFFSRIWRRKLSLVAVGMIVFHSSFLVVLGGVIYNSLYSFRGVLRLTEGETLSNDQPESYDLFEHGRFFDFSRLRGQTTLLAMHTAYDVDGHNKQAAYDVLVGDDTGRTRETIYVTRHLGHRGVRYFRSKEGYSLLLVLYDSEGREFYGAHVPLQSLKQPNGSYLYTTGTSTSAGAFAFPQDPVVSLLKLQVVYLPSPELERAGMVEVTAWPLSDASAPLATPARVGRGAIGEVLPLGDHFVEARQVRYWVAMDVRYDPALNVILATLCAGLFGMVLTFVGRLRQEAAKKKPRPAQAGGAAPSG